MARDVGITGVVVTSAGKAKKNIILLRRKAGEVAVMVKPFYHARDAGEPAKSAPETSGM